MLCQRVKYTLRENTVIFKLRFERQMKSSKNAKNTSHYALHKRSL